MPRVKKSNEKNRLAEKKQDISGNGISSFLAWSKHPVVIENVTPEIDGGIYAAKAVVGERVTVEADIFKDGRDILRGVVRFRPKSQKKWAEIPLVALDNDRWGASFTPDKNTRYVYTIRAWSDPLSTWLENTRKKCLAGQDIPSDITEGVRLISELGSKAVPAEQKQIKKLISLLELSRGIHDEVLRVLENSNLSEWAEKYPLKRCVSELERPLELIVDREAARFGAWYELFPRSQGKTAKKSGTFADCVNRLSDIKKMGFNILYLSPIHPVGQTHRKGRNNTLTATDNDPGCPWAIGDKTGGHKAVHPDLGTLKDFERFVNEAGKKGIEIALDLAFQCSPDHPYVKEHPDWFYRYPDGHIHYAENPPKKYEDIYPINFYCEDAAALWSELKSIVLFWIERGVKIFRVDNPHTKPLRFWKWLIDEIQNEYPEVIFLSEAFTRPKVMKFLAKAGFTQSYTYFTWRNNKWELREYLKELTQTGMKEYFRGNFFANTPDILHEYLQTGGVPAFKIRAALAATLSSSYGIYSGFELCENTPKEPGSEEYLHSEKYEIKPRNWNQKGNIKDYLGRLNQIREENPALREYKNLRFFHSNNDNVLCYGKKTGDNSNLIVVVVNLNPHQAEEDTISLPIWDFGIEGWQTYQAKDLITGEKYYWRGERNYIRLDPNFEPVHILSLKK